MATRGTRDDDRERRPRGDAQRLRPLRGRGADLPRVGGGRLLQAPGRRTALHGDHAAAQPDRRAAHGPRPHSRRRGRPDPLASHARRRHRLGARRRPRRDRRQRARRAPARRGRREPPRHRARGLPRARLGVRQRLAGAHRRAAPAARRLGRLGSRGVHARRGAPARRPPDLREPLRGRPDLPRRADDQLGHRRPDGALRPRGRVPRCRVLVLVRALPRARRGGRAGGRLHRDRDDAAGDDPGRHRRGRASRRRALAPPDRAHGAGADLGPPDPGDRRRGDRDRGGVRRAQGDARPRPRRLRDRRAARAGDDQHPRARRDAQRARRALRRHRPLRGARPRRRGPRGEGADREDRALHARRRALAALGRGGGADRLGAVVGERRPARRAGNRGGARRPHRVRAEALRTHLPALDGEHPRLVHQPPDLVGPPHPRLVLRRRGLRRDHRGRRGPRRLPVLRRRAAAG